MNDNKEKDKASGSDLDAKTADKQVEQVKAEAAEAKPDAAASEKNAPVSEAVNEITAEKASETAEKKHDTTQAEKKYDFPEMLTVSPSPHVRTEDTTRSIMIDVCIALIPALIWGIFVFGARALTVTAISVAFSVLSEFIYEKLMKKPLTISDFSAVVTGLLLAMNLPASVPLWMPAVGAIFAIIVVKQLFGGLGKNFMNPALAARVFLFTAWPAHMTVFTKPGERLGAFALSSSVTDAVAGATPLVKLKTGGIPDMSIFDMLLGWEAGCIGEVSALLLAAGFVYLLVRRVINWKIPVIYIGVVLVFGYLAARSTLPFDYAFSEIFSGGLFLGAIFMATDYSTSPITERGRVIYALGCGLLTVFIRKFGGYPEGVSFSILIMNLLVWYLDRYAKPVKFGGAVNAKSSK